VVCQWELTKQKKQLTKPKKQLTTRRCEQATAPFLHNASVPTLHDLLSRGAERPATVWLGNLEFDPVKVGIDPREFARGTRLDTTLPGNSNRGHEFDDAPAGTPGVIGPKLSPQQRRELVEYLKTL
jgi:hypothetical protein